VLLIRQKRLVPTLVDPPFNLLRVVLRVPRRAVDRGPAKQAVPAGGIVVGTQEAPKRVSTVPRLLQPPTVPLCIPDTGLDILVRVLPAGHFRDSSLDFSVLVVN